MTLNRKTVLFKSYLYMVKGNLVVIILLLCCNAQLLGQSQYLLNITVSDMDSSAFHKEFKYAKQFKPKEGYHGVLKKLWIDLYDAAYITARFDSINVNLNEVMAFLTMGKQIKWAKLSPGSADEGALSQIGFRDKMYRNKTFYHTDLKQLSNKLLSYYENNGYPFAQIWFDELELEDEEISLEINLDKKREIRVDSMILHGNVKITRIYLRSYLGIKPGKLYDESIISKIDKRIKVDFPHKFDRKEGSAKTVQTVASVKRGVKPGRKSVKLTSSQVQIARKLNVPLEEYAKQLLNVKEV